MKDIRIKTISAVLLLIAAFGILPKASAQETVQIPAETLSEDTAVPEERP